MRKSEMPQFGLMEGIKVLNCGSLIAVSYACGLFSEHGADVTHVESAKSPDLFRNFGKGYSMEHRNQRNIAVDMSSPEGQDILFKMLPDTDILMESSVAGTWEEWGLTDEVLWKHKPDLVIVHVTGYGLEGDPKYVVKPAFDMVGQAFSGHLALNGTAERPLLTKIYTSDYTSGAAAAWSSLAALLRARQTGEGESIDLAMYETTARIQAGLSLEGLTWGTQPARTGNTDAKCATDVVFHTKDDQWVVITVVNPSQKYLDLIGLGDDPEFIPKPNFVAWADPRGKKYNQSCIDFCASHTLEEVLSSMEAIGVGCCEVMTYEKMATNPHYAARNSIVSWYDPASEQEVKGIGAVPKVRKRPGQIWRGSPSRGMDTRDIMEELGYNAGEIEALLGKKVIL